MCDALTPRIRTNARVYLHCVAAACIGFVAWRGAPALITLTAVIPVLVFLQQSRLEAFSVIFAYYATANWPLIPGVLGYFSPSGTILQALAFWAVPSLLLPLPWIACWTPALSQAVWRLPLAYFLSVVPPLGIIGWASPVTGAGILFPGWSWIGLGSLVTMSALAVSSPIRAGLVTISLAVLANAFYLGSPPSPESWEGVYTNFDRVTDPVDPLPEFRVAESIRRTALTSNKRVIVFPEFVVPQWTEATETFWQPTLADVRASGKTLLIGVGLPITGTSRYRNAVLTVGKDTASPFLQRVPVPVIMWNPLKPERAVPLRLFGPGFLEVEGQRAAILVCYEQLLSWPILQSAVQHPTLIVGLANDNWAKGTPIPAAQQSAVTAWARLFRLPKVMAVNL
jgi:Carbon-nitrogen hydrolase